jgi:hypothetical protein
MTRNARPTLLIAAIVFGFTFLAGAADAQTRRSNSTRPAATPTPRAEPEVISRADQFIDENGRVVTPTENRENVELVPADVRPERTVAELEERIRQLEAGKKDTPDDKQRRLALNLDILTKAEQRVESLRKQFFDMVEKEGEIQQRLDTVELDIRPDSIERNVAFAGSLRPEVLREARQKNLAAERTKLQTLLTEVQRNKANLETNIARADSLVDRLRTKLEREIDEALIEDEKAIDRF